MRPKFSRFSPDSPEYGTPLLRPRRWRRERVGPGERLLIQVDANGIELLSELSAGFVEPLGILYELLLSRKGKHPEGRYQSPRPFERWEVLHFLVEYQAFLAGDGRHNVWVAETEGEGQLIYDQHELLFAYGDLERYEHVLRKLGYEEGELDLPVPHSHAYNSEFDADEDRILAEFEWMFFAPSTGREG